MKLKVRNDMPRMIATAFSGAAVADVGPTCGVFSVMTPEEVARRLVACWNLCEGIPIEVLEAQANAPKAQLPAPALFTHDLLDHAGKSDGIVMGCDDRDVVERSHIDGQTAKEIVRWYSEAQFRAALISNMGAQPQPQSTLERLGVIVETDGGQDTLAPDSPINSVNGAGTHKGS